VTLLRRISRALGVALAMVPAAYPAAPPGEYQVKAVYLFNFGQFVEWPAQSFTSPTDPFVICIVGADPFGKTIDEVVRGEALGARPLEVRRFGRGGEIDRCNILFIGRTEAPRLRDTLAAVKGRSVLTVTDIDGAERDGAIIVLFKQDNRIRMRINVAEAKASNLVISSKLLRPAEVIGAEAG
jgi:hypothetical protein